MSGYAATGFDLVLAALVLTTAGLAVSVRDLFGAVVFFIVYPLRLGTIWSALWPAAIGLALIAAMGAARWPAGTLDEADPLRAARWSGAALAPLRVIPGHLASRRSDLADRAHTSLRHIGAMLAQGAERLEHALLRWSMGGVVVMIFILAVTASVALAR